MRITFDFKPVDELAPALHVTSAQAILEPTEVRARDLTLEIMRQVEALPVEQQRHVLTYVTSIGLNTPQGEPGRNFLSFAGTLDQESAEEMIAAIEEGCETIDESGW